MQTPRQIASILLPFEIVLSPQQMEQVEEYTRLLLKWNARINLTRVGDEKKIYQEHFGESFYLSKFLPPSCRSVVDVGSGAGFPGLALKILRTPLAVTLVESSGRKGVFLQEVIHALGLATGTRVVAGRFEQFLFGREETFDAATVRGVRLQPHLLACFHTILRTAGRLVVTTSRARAEGLRASQADRWVWREVEQIPLASSRVVLVGEKRSTWNIKKLGTLPGASLHFDARAFCGRF
jgi:16S rRNA (guanine527-N7)-methyltransferase